MTRKRRNRPESPAAIRPRVRDRRINRALLPLADVPIACTLSEAELRERRRMLLESTRKAAISVTELVSGCAYCFEPTSEILLDLAGLIDMERDCCPFLTFTLVVSAGRQPIRLEITGTPQAKAIIAEFFGS